MPTPLKYIGTTDPYFETSVTGKPDRWSPGRINTVPDNDAALLQATGLFIPAYTIQVINPFAPQVHLIKLTELQFAMPTAEILADTRVLYESAGIWYRSNGSALINISSAMTGSDIASILDAYLGGPEWRTGGGSGGGSGPLAGALLLDSSPIYLDSNQLVLS